MLYVKHKFNELRLTRGLPRIQFCLIQSEIHHHTDMITACKHPKVRVVAREEDAEFVECLECGEVFDSNEFRDMAIEETTDENEES